MKCKFKLNTTAVDSIDKLDLSDLSFEDVCAHYCTGRTIVKGSKQDRTYCYRKGIGTNAGDIEQSVWCEIVNHLIVRAQEQKLFQYVKEWVKENSQRWRNIKELELEALKLHSMRIFDNPDWYGYVNFNSKYRPEILTQECVL